MDAKSYNIDREVYGNEIETVIDFCVMEEVVIPINIVCNRIKDGGVRMDALRREEIHTIDDIYALPERERAELIDGKIYYMAPPSWKHQRMSGRLYQTIANYIDSQNGQCEVLAAPFAVFLNNDDTNYLEPDISVICDRSRLDDKGCHGAPDWVIEIVSPSSRPMDYFTKLFKYRTSGVREYWIVDSIKQRVTVYFFEKETVEEYSFGTDIPVGIYEGFSIRVE